MVTSAPRARVRALRVDLCCNRDLSSDRTAWPAESVVAEGYCYEFGVRQDLRCCELNVLHPPWSRPAASAELHLRTSTA